MRNQMVRIAVHVVVLSTTSSYMKVAWFPYSIDKSVRYGKSPMYTVEYCIDCYDFYFVESMPKPIIISITLTTLATRR